MRIVVNAVRKTNDPNPTTKNRKSETREIIMFDIHRVEIEWGGRKLKLETGHIARQADAAVLAQYGETLFWRPLSATDRFP